MCYIKDTLRRDPGVRNYWGKGIRKFWKGMFAASGCLSGSIWVSINDVFMLPSSCVGLGQWGILDGWRRQKPEYWLTKKAYSPTRLDDRHVLNPGRGNPSRIPITNRFNYTNLNEIGIKWSVGSDHGEITNLNVGPHGTGVLELPGHAWSNGERVDIRFADRTGRLLDHYELPVGRALWSLRARPTID